MLRRVGHKLHRFVLGLALLPFLMLSLIGTGLMPARAADGAIMLVICTDAGMVEMAFDPVTMQPLKDQGDAPSADPCDWAAAQPAFALVTFSQVILPLAPSAAPDMPAITTTRMVAMATGLPPATGPPALL